jgi:hypothetical protein
MATRSRAKAHQVDLALDTLGHLAGGTAGFVVDAALRNALRDTEDRGMDKKARTVTITVSMNKIGKDKISIGLKAKTALPPYVTDDTIGDLGVDERGKPECSFSQVSGENPDQDAIPGTRED